MRDITRQYLFDYLAEEFQSSPNVRVRLVRPQPLVRDEAPEEFDDAFDEKDAAPEPPDGVIVKTPSREYFFESQWVESRQMNRVEALVRQIKDLIDR